MLLMSCGAEEGLPEAIQSAPVLRGVTDIRGHLRPDEVHRIENRESRHSRQGSRDSVHEDRAPAWPVSEEEALVEVVGAEAESCRGHDPHQIREIPSPEISEPLGRDQVVRDERVQSLARRICCAQEGCPSSETGNKRVKYMDFSFQNSSRCIRRQGGWGGSTDRASDRAGLLSARPS